MKILAPGTDVTIEQATIPGKITAASIRVDHVSYEVTYYADYMQRTVWCAESELMIKPKQKKLEVGFK